MNGYLVPANAKKGTLFLNIFRPFDAIMFGTGIFVSFIALMIMQNSDTITVIICLIPALITGLLVIPIPNYHNVLCALQSVYRFYSLRRRYIWKGWCFYERFANEEKSK